VSLSSFLAFDIGNSRTHVGKFQEFRSDEMPLPVDTFSYPTLSSQPPELDSWLGGEKLPWFAISVQRQGLERLRRLAEQDEMAESISVLIHTDLPIQTSLVQPGKVGADRLAAAVAANQVRTPGRAALVIDAGTAITIDAVDEDGVFVGGAILPGIGTMARALAQQTDQLPDVFVDLNKSPKAIGIDTTSALQSGLFWGSVGGIKETIRRITSQLNTNQPPQLFFSGGDVKAFAPWVDLPVEVVPDMALRGVAVAVRSRTA